MNEVLDKSIKYIEESKIGLLITVDENNKPQSRYIGPYINNDFNIAFTTARDSKKVKEIIRNRYVAMYFHNGNSGDEISVQINGKATIVEDTIEQSRYITKMGEKSERMKNWINGKDFKKYCFIKIETETIQYTNLKNEMKTVKLDIK